MEKVFGKKLMIDRFHKAVVGMSTDVPLPEISDESNESDDSDTNDYKSIDSCFFIPVENINDDVVSFDVMSEEAHTCMNTNANLEDSTDDLKSEIAHILVDLHASREGPDKSDVSRLFYSLPEKWTEEMNAYVAESLALLDALNETSRASKQEVERNNLLQKKLYDARLKICDPPTPGDGNCLYHALAQESNMLLQWHGLTQADMRNALADFLDDHKEDWEERVAHDLNDMEMTWDAYIEGVRTQGVWGDQVVLTAAAWMLQSNIKIVSSTMTRTIEPPCMVGTELPTIYLAYIEGLHYSAAEQIQHTEAHSDNRCDDTSEYINEQFDDMSSYVMTVMSENVPEAKKRHMEYFQNTDNDKYLYIQKDRLGFASKFLDADKTIHNKGDQMYIQSSPVSNKAQQSLQRRCFLRQRKQ
ncbi:uncharacterized protein [Antedon mediterranea]|uniref:uncharacterized protein isoform X2 n=1 Tax=Antedon mediterranea TaxID=105859 RepID=UPI003AF588A9